MIMDNLYNSSKYKRFVFYGGRSDDIYKSPRAAQAMTGEEWNLLSAREPNARNLSEVALRAACLIYRNGNHATGGVQYQVYGFMRRCLQNGSITEDQIDAACAS